MINLAYGLNLCRAILHFTVSFSFILAKGSNMSIYVCVCKGEYDALQTWPFAMTVTLILVDQCQDPRAKVDHTYVLKPNPCKVCMSIDSYSALYKLGNRSTISRSWFTVSDAEQLISECVYCQLDNRSQLCMKSDIGERD